MIVERSITHAILRVWLMRAIKTLRRDKDNNFHPHTQSPFRSAALSVAPRTLQSKPFASSRYHEWCCFA